MASEGSIALKLSLFRVSGKKTTDRIACCSIFHVLVLSSSLTALTVTSSVQRSVHPFLLPMSQFAQDGKFVWAAILAIYPVRKAYNYSVYE
jgi:hypothetical protein